MAPSIDLLNQSALVCTLCILASGCNLFGATEQPGQQNGADVSFADVYADASVADMASVDAGTDAAQADMGAPDDMTQMDAAVDMSPVEALAPGQRVQIDFGAAADAAGWNVLSDTMGSLTGLTDSDGTPTSVGLHVSVAFSGANADGVGANQLGWPAAATRDTLWAGSFDSHEAGLAAPAEFYLDNLTPGAEYDLRLFASRERENGNNPDRLTRYTVGDQQIDVEATDNVDQTADFIVNADPAGRITIGVAVSPDGDGTFGYLGVLELTGR